MHHLAFVPFWQRVRECVLSKWAMIAFLLESFPSANSKYLPYFAPSVDRDA